MTIDKNFDDNRSKITIHQCYMYFPTTLKNKTALVKQGFRHA